MTLPSSGALSLSQLQTEFGGINPVSMSEYYAGGWSRWRRRKRYWWIDTQ